MLWSSQATAHSVQAANSPAIQAIAEYWDLILVIAAVVLLIIFYCSFGRMAETTPDAIAEGVETTTCVLTR